MGVKDLIGSFETSGSSHSTDGEQFASRNGGSTRSQRRTVPPPASSDNGNNPSSAAAARASSRRKSSSSGRNKAPAPPPPPPPRVPRCSSSICSAAETTSVVSAEEGSIAMCSIDTGSVASRSGGGGGEDLNPHRQRPHRQRHSGRPGRGRSGGGGGGGATNKDVSTSCHSRTSHQSSCCTSATSSSPGGGGGGGGGFQSHPPLDVRAPPRATLSGSIPLDFRKVTKNLSSIPAVSSHSMDGNEQQQQQSTRAALARNNSNATSVWGKVIMAGGGGSGNGTGSGYPPRRLAGCDGTDHSSVADDNGYPDFAAAPSSDLGEYDDQQTRCTPGVFSTAADANVAYCMEGDSGHDRNLMRQSSTLGTFLKKPSDGDTGATANKTIVTSAVSEASPGLSVEVFSKKKFLSSPGAMVAEGSKSSLFSANKSRNLFSLLDGQCNQKHAGEGDGCSLATPRSEGSSSRMVPVNKKSPSSCGAGVSPCRSITRNGRRICISRRRSGSSGGRSGGFVGYGERSFSMISSDEEDCTVGRPSRSSRSKSLDNTVQRFGGGGSKSGHSSWTSGFPLSEDSRASWSPFLKCKRRMKSTNSEQQQMQDIGAALEYDPYQEDPHLGSSASCDVGETAQQRQQQNSNSEDENENDKSRWWEDSDHHAKNNPDNPPTAITPIAGTNHHKEACRPPVTHGMMNRRDLLERIPSATDHPVPVPAAAAAAAAEAEPARPPPGDVDQLPTPSVPGVDPNELNDFLKHGNAGDDNDNNNVAEGERIELCGEHDGDDEEASLTLEDLQLPEGTGRVSKDGTEVVSKRKSSKVHGKALLSSNSDKAEIASFQLKRQKQQPEPFKMPAPCKPEIQKIQLPGTAPAGPTKEKAETVAKHTITDIDSKNDNDGAGYADKGTAQQPQQDVAAADKVADKPFDASIDDFSFDDGCGVPHVVDAVVKPFEDFSLLDGGEDQSCMSIPLPRPPPLAAKSPATANKKTEGSGAVGRKKKIIKVRSTKPNGDPMTPKTLKQTVKRMQASGDLSTDAEIATTGIKKKKKKVIKRVAAGPVEGSQRSTRSRSTGPAGENSQRSTRSRSNIGPAGENSQRSTPSRSKAPSGEDRARGRSKGPPPKSASRGDCSLRSRGRSMGRKNGPPPKMETEDDSRRKARSKSTGHRNMDGSQRKARSTSIGPAAGSAKQRARSKSRPRAEASEEPFRSSETKKEPEGAPGGRGRWGLGRKPKPADDENDQQKQERGRSVGPQKHGPSGRGRSADRAGGELPNPGNFRCKSLGPGTKGAAAAAKKEKRGRAAARPEVSGAVASKKASSRSKSLGRPGPRSKSVGRRVSTGTGSTEPTTPSAPSSHKRMGNFFQTIKNAVAKTPRSPSKKFAKPKALAVAEPQADIEKPTSGGILKKKKIKQPPQKPPEPEHFEEEVQQQKPEEQERKPPPPACEDDYSFENHEVPMSIDIIPESMHTYSSTMPQSSAMGGAPPSPLTCSSPNHHRHERPSPKTSPKHERRVSDVSDDVMFRTIKEVGVTEDMLEKLFEAGLVITEG